MAQVGKSGSTLRTQALIAVVVIGLMWIGSALALRHSVLQRDPYWLMGAFVGFVFVVVPASNYSLIYTRGYLGERGVFGRLRRLPDHYWVLNDITVTAGDRRAQIDHVLVSPAGLWCVETKSHLGMVLGRERERNWTQVKHSERGRRYKKKLYNPIRQNATHCRVLSDYLEDHLGLRPPVKSIVVFTSAKLQVESRTPVLKPGALTETILAGDTEQALRENHVSAIVSLLARGRGSATGAAEVERDEQVPQDDEPPGSPPDDVVAGSDDDGAGGPD